MILNVAITKNTLTLLEADGLDENACSRECALGDFLFGLVLYLFMFLCAQWVGFVLYVLMFMGGEAGGLALVLGDCLLPGDPRVLALLCCLYFERSLNFIFTILYPLGTIQAHQATSYRNNFGNSDHFLVVWTMTIRKC